MRTKSLSYTKKKFAKEIFLLDRGMLFDVLKRTEPKVKKLEDIFEFLRENQCYVQLVPGYARFIRLLLTISGSSCIPTNDLPRL